MHTPKFGKRKEYEKAFRPWNLLVLNAAKAKAGTSDDNGPISPTSPTRSIPFDTQSQQFATSDNNNTRRSTMPPTSPSKDPLNIKTDDTNSWANTTTFSQESKLPTPALKSPDHIVNTTSTSAQDNTPASWGPNNPPWETTPPTPATPTANSWKVSWITTMDGNTSVKKEDNSWGTGTTVDTSERTFSNDITNNASRTTSALPPSPTVEQQTSWNKEPTTISAPASRRGTVMESNMNTGGGSWGSGVLVDDWNQFHQGMKNNAASTTAISEHTPTPPKSEISPSISTESTNVTQPFSQHPTATAATSTTVVSTSPNPTTVSKIDQQILSQSSAYTPPQDNPQEELLRNKSEALTLKDWSKPIDAAGFAAPSLDIESTTATECTSNDWTKSTALTEKWTSNDDSAAKETIKHDCVSNNDSITKEAALSDNWPSTSPTFSSPNIVPGSFLPTSSTSNQDWSTSNITTTAAAPLAADSNWSSSSEDAHTALTTVSSSPVLHASSNDNDQKVTITSNNWTKTSDNASISWSIDDEEDVILKTTPSNINNGTTIDTIKVVDWPSPPQPQPPTPHQVDNASSNDNKNAEQKIVEKVPKSTFDFSNPCWDDEDDEHPLQSKPDSSNHSTRSSPKETRTRGFSTDDSIHNPTNKGAHEDEDTDEEWIMSSTMSLTPVVPPQQQPSFSLDVREPLSSSQDQTHTNDMQRYSKEELFYMNSQPESSIGNTAANRIDRQIQDATMRKQLKQHDMKPSITISRPVRQPPKDHSGGFAPGIPPAIERTKIVVYYDL